MNSYELNRSKLLSMKYQLSRVVYVIKYKSVCFLILSIIGRIKKSLLETVDLINAYLKFLLCKKCEKSV